MSSHVVETGDVEPVVFRSKVLGSVLLSSWCLPGTRWTTDRFGGVERCYPGGKWDSLLAGMVPRWTPRRRRVDGRVRVTKEVGPGRGRSVLTGRLVGTSGV